jgi:hypothetical protein
MRSVVWGQLDQDCSIRPNLNMVGPGLYCRTHGARNVSLGDAGQAARHFSGNPWVGNSSFPKKAEVGLQPPTISIYLKGTKAIRSLPAKKDINPCRQKGHPIPPLRQMFDRGHCPGCSSRYTLERTMSQKIDLSGFRYRPDHFTLGCPIVQDALWSFVLRPENVVRMEAVTAVERPAVEALSEPLVLEFGRQIAQSPIKQMLGHMVRQLMEALEYQVDRHRVRINRPGLFATGMTFRRPGQPRGRSVTVAAEHRREWLNAAETDEFNCWLDGIIANADGTTDLERLCGVAAKWEIKLWGYHPILDRIKLGIILRGRVAPAEYESGRARKRVADADDAKRLKDEADFTKQFGMSPSFAEVEGALDTETSSVRPAKST